MDSRFSKGSTDSRRGGGAPTYNFAKISKNPHEIDNIFVLRFVNADASNIKTHRFLILSYRRDFRRRAGYPRHLQGTYYNETQVEDLVWFATYIIDFDIFWTLFQIFLLFMIFMSDVIWLVLQGQGVYRLTVEQPPQNHFRAFFIEVLNYIHVFYDT